MGCLGAFVVLRALQGALGAFLGHPVCGCSILRVPVVPGHQSSMGAERWQGNWHGFSSHDEGCTTSGVTGFLSTTVTYSHGSANHMCSPMGPRSAQFPGYSNQISGTKRNVRLGTNSSCDFMGLPGVHRHQGGPKWGPTRSVP